MRFVLAAVALLIAGSAPGPAQADPYRWCATYGADDSGGTNCYFVTLQQCEWAVSGQGGYCAGNPFYDGKPVTPGRAEPVRRKKRRG